MLASHGYGIWPENRSVILTCGWHLKGRPNVRTNTQIPICIWKHPKPRKIFATYGYEIWLEFWYTVLHCSNCFSFFHLFEAEKDPAAQDGNTSGNPCLAGNVLDFPPKRRKRKHGSTQASILRRPGLLPGGLLCIHCGFCIRRRRRRDPTLPEMLAQAGRVSG